MATATYTGTLTDVGVNSLAGYTPELTVRPERECWGPDGPLTDTRVKIPLTGDAFSVDLTPSTQLTNDKGVSGVGYILEVDLLDAAGFHAEWRFNALPGGGSIADMIGVPVDPGPPFWSLVTDAELDARVDGLVDELDLATVLKCVYLEGGDWVWVGRDSPLATHYVLPDHTGKQIVRARPFPTPGGANAPELTWN